MKNALIILATAALLASCGATQDKAAKYNNALVQIQEDLYYLNDSVDHEFVTNVWYYEPGDPKIEEFASTYRARYARLTAALDEIKDLSGHNQMKEALGKFIAFCSDELDNYYLALINDTAEGTDKKEGIQASHDGQFTEHEQNFIAAQKALAEEFNLSFAFEEEIKH